MVSRELHRRDVLKSAGGGIALAGFLPTTGTATRCPATGRRRFAGTVSTGERSTHTYAVRSEEPCSVTITLTGAEDADLDLYVTLDGRTPTPAGYDRRSRAAGAGESVTLSREDLAPGTTLGITVVAYRDGGRYEVRVEETGEGTAGGAGDCTSGDRPASGNGTDLTLVFANTYLMPGVAGIKEAPRRSERAEAFGRVVDEEGVDVAALCEVFTPEDRATLRGAIDGPVESRTGPEGYFYQFESGLQTVVPGGRGNRVTAADQHWFDAGSHFAAKGVLYTQVDVGPGAIDLFSTHAYADVGIDDGFVGPDADYYRRQQVEELVSFVRATKDEHDPDGRNPTVVCGDFNVAAQSDEYETLAWMTDELDLYDAWRRHRSGAGPTWTAREDRTYDGGGAYEICEFDPEGTRPHYCTETDFEDGMRLDYLFLDRAKDSHAISLDVTALRRRPWWRNLDADPGESRLDFWQSGEREVPNYLSDHLGLEARFCVTPA